MKNLSNIFKFVAIMILSSCATDISQTPKFQDPESAFLEGEKLSSNNQSYILNAKVHHPFIFHDALDVVKDKSVSKSEKADLVYNTIKNHIELNGVKVEDRLDVQKLILYLYGNYNLIDPTLQAIEKEEHKYFLNTLIEYEAIDFKYLAKISDYIKMDDTYTLTQSKLYLEKYTNIVSDKSLDQNSRYGAHCRNIIESCNEAIRILQNT